MSAKAYPLRFHSAKWTWYLNILMVLILWKNVCTSSYGLILWCALKIKTPHNVSVHQGGSIKFDFDGKKVDNYLHFKSIVSFLCWWLTRLTHLVLERAKEFFKGHLQYWANSIFRVNLKYSYLIFGLPACMTSSLVYQFVGSQSRSWESQKCYLYCNKHLEWA